MELQPFVRLQREYIQGFVRMKKIYLVSQFYKNGNEPEATPPKEAILFTDYDDKWLAHAHYEAIKGDKYAYVLDLSNPVHKEKVISMMNTDSKHVAYWAAVMSKEQLAKELNERYTDNIRHYIKAKTSWRIGGKDTLHPLVQVIFGELYITFRYAGEELRIKLKEIENV